MMKRLLVATVFSIAASSVGAIEISEAMLNGYLKQALAEKAIESGHADMVAFGKAFISNPDLVERLKADAPLNAWDQSTFYGGGEKGYTDYPAMG